MAYMHFPRQWLDELVSRADMLQIVSEHVQLKKNGTNYMGLCPFHHEKTASFSVNPVLNVYHCFGCKAGGNLIDFVMSINHMSFQEAVEYLANRYNMKLPEEQEDPHQEQKRLLSERVYSVNKEAAMYYHQTLWSSNGKSVLNYFYSRGLNDQIIRKFGLGASTTDRNHLKNYLLQKGFSEEDMSAAGLITRSGDKIRDMFFSRALFPIIDLYGRVLGFGGRTLEPDVKPKYLNTADTIVFNKRKGVYAANLLKKQTHLERIILVEGYLDVISLNQFGITGVVATLGTALTVEQVRFLKRFAPAIWLAYDGDDAGQRAIERGIDLCAQENVQCKVLYFPDNQDPDEFIRCHSKKDFDALLPLDAVSYQLMRLEQKNPLISDEARMAYAKEACKVLNNIHDPVEMEYYQKNIAEKSGFSFDTIRAQVTAGSKADHAVKRVAGEKKSNHDYSEVMNSEKVLIALLAQKELPDNTVHPEDFIHALFINTARELSKGSSISDILNNLDEEDDKRILTEAMMTATAAEAGDAVRTAKECLKVLSKERLNKELNEYKIKLQQENDENTRKYLLERITELRRLISDNAH